MDFYELIETKHAGQIRNKSESGTVPYTDHLYGVATVISSALNLTSEVSDEQLFADIVNAALGHDLIEDTDVSEAEIFSVANERTLKFIRELTNPVDDAHTEEYMIRLSTASEEARLVKYADLIENTLSVAYNIRLLGKDWLDGFYMPILTKTTAVLLKTQFEQYPKTAEILRDQLYTVTKLLNTKSRIAFGMANGDELWSV